MEVSTLRPATKPQNTVTWLLLLCLLPAILTSCVSWEPEEDEEPAPRPQQERPRFVRGLSEAQRDWLFAVGDHIAPFWERPANVTDDIACRLNIVVRPDGVVTSVSVIESSGNPTYDQSLIQATWKASPLPLPADPAAFWPTLRPKYSPRDLFPD